MKESTKFLATLGGIVMIQLSVTPQILFALNKPELAVQLQGVYEYLSKLPPGFVQGIIATLGGVILRFIPTKSDEKK